MQPQETMETLNLGLTHKGQYILGVFLHLGEGSTLGTGMFWADGATGLGGLRFVLCSTTDVLLLVGRIINSQYRKIDAYVFEATPTVESHASAQSTLTRCQHILGG